MVNNAVDIPVSQRPLTRTFTNINTHSVKIGRQNKDLALENALGLFPQTHKASIIMRKTSDKPKLRDILPNI